MKEDHEFKTNIHTHICTQTNVLKKPPNFQLLLRKKKLSLRNTSIAQREVWRCTVIQDFFFFFGKSLLYARITLDLLYGGSPASTSSFWQYRRTLPCPIYMALGIEPRVPCAGQALCQLRFIPQLKFSSVSRCSTWILYLAHIHRPTYHTFLWWLRK